MKAVTVRLLLPEGVSLEWVRAGHPMEWQDWRKIKEQVLDVGVEHIEFSVELDRRTQ